MQPINFTDKYAIDCVGFVSFCIHHSLGIGAADAFTSFVLPTMYNQPSQGFEKVKDGSRQPGDILATHGHVAIYIGNGEIIDSAAAGPDRSISRRKTANNYQSTFRISTGKAANIDKDDTTVQFQGKGSSDYSFEGSGGLTSESLTETLILSGTPPSHWKRNCKDFAGYFSWTNVKYSTASSNESGTTNDYFSSDIHVDIDTGSETIDALLNAALSQSGYAEGTNNDNKFGIWYNMNYQPWCAMFVSWCANEAGILGTVIPRYASCAVGRDWYRSQGRFYLANGEYEPKAGDVFFTSSSSYPNGGAHTGIVVAYKDGYIYTIEGNSDNRVRSRSLALSKIYGFGSNGGASSGTVPSGSESDDGGSTY